MAKKIWLIMCLVGIGLGITAVIIWRSIARQKGSSDSHGVADARDRAALDRVSTDIRSAQDAIADSSRRSDQAAGAIENAVDGIDGATRITSTIETGLAECATRAERIEAEFTNSETQLDKLDELNQRFRNILTEIRNGNSELRN